MMHVYSNFKSCTGTLEDKKYLQVSLDGPNVNLPFFDILDEATIIFIIFWDSFDVLPNFPFTTSETMHNYYL